MYYSFFLLYFRCRILGAHPYICCLGTLYSTTAHILWKLEFSYLTPICSSPMLLLLDGYVMMHRLTKYSALRKSSEIWIGTKIRSLHMKSSWKAVNRTQQSYRYIYSHLVSLPSSCLFIHLTFVFVGFVALRWPSLV